jgi:acyl carrier protein
MTADDVDAWDSLNHINLISAIEKEFKIRFALGELQKMKNVDVLIEMIIKKMGSA